jgi:hypothetical protein
MLVLRPRKNRSAWLHAFIADQLTTLALVQDSITHQDFVAHLVPLMPRGDAVRDQREFMAVRALKRMVVLGTLPCRIEGDRFILP